MFAFGHGLSYTGFDYRDLVVTGGDSVAASFSVVNVGDRSGADVPQLYLTAAPDEQRLRLLGFERVELEPGESRRVTIEADPRLLARYDGGAGMLAYQRRAAMRWRSGASAVAPRLTAEVELAGRSFARLIVQRATQPDDRRAVYLTGTNSSPQVQRYGSPEPEQWHATSMRTRHPQPSWPQVSKVPSS